MSYTFRRAGVSEIDALVQLRHDFIRSDVGSLGDEDRAALSNYRDFLLDVMANGSFVQWLCELDGKIAATGSVNFYRLPPTHRRPNGREAYIGNMFTYPAHRRKGLAKKVLQLLFDEARATDCMSIVLHTSPDGRPLYESFGFVDSDNYMRLSL